MVQQDAGAGALCRSQAENPPVRFPRGQLVESRDQWSAGLLSTGIALPGAFGLSYAMIQNDLLTRVEKHYASTDRPLLLSELGQHLRQAGGWPPDGEARPLAEIVQALAPRLSLVRDPKARAYAIVVPAGKENLAKSAIEQRHKFQLLRSLPRSILLAFCVQAPAATDIYLRLEPPHRYVVGDKPDDPTYVPIEAEYRSPGLFLGADRHVAPEDAKRLMEGIESWAQRHDVQLDKLTGPNKGTGPAALVASPTKHTSALERLYAAQAPDISSKMMVPFDIAMVLSRLP